MHRIDMTPTEATTLVALIASHLPIGYSLGQVYAATPQGLITTDRAAWGLDRGGDGHAWRMVQVSASIWERTTWRDGTELSRRIVRERPDEDADDQHRG